MSLGEQVPPRDAGGAARSLSVLLKLPPQQYREQFGDTVGRPGDRVGRRRGRSTRERLREIDSVGEYLSLL